MALPMEWRHIGLVQLQQGMRIVRRWPWRLLGTLGILALLVPLALWGYALSAHAVTIDVDGEQTTVRTHQRLVGGVLHQAGLSLGPADVVYPPVDAPWNEGQAILVRRALSADVLADGRQLRYYGRPGSLLEVLAHVGVVLHPRDDVYVNSMIVPESAYPDETALRTLLSLQRRVVHLAAPTAPGEFNQIRVVRAIPLFLRDNGIDLELRTTATTLGAALEEAGLYLYRADQVSPPLDTPVQPGLRVDIARALPVTLTVDGRTYTTRTWAETVGDLLQEEGVALGQMDQVWPAPDSPVREGLAVRIVRVTTLDVTEQSPIPYRELQEADPSLELDHYRLRPGEQGLLERITRITYEDGSEVGREFLGQVVTKEPVDQIFYYGTNIVVRTMETPDGPIEYWRKIRVWATSYYPSTCDKEPDHPEYGITYTGKRATRGIIAVDPRIIPLHTRMYVPGYGFGAAEDIGGAIKGRHIDLCFDDWDQGKGLWSTRYVDVYLLTPVPPLHKIPWIIH